VQDVWRRAGKSVHVCGVYICIYVCGVYNTYVYMCVVCAECVVTREGHLCTHIYAN